MHDEAQLTHDQLTGRVEVVVVVELFRQFALFLRAQHRDRADGLNVCIQILTRREITQCQYARCHRFLLPSKFFRMHVSTSVPFSGRLS